VTQCPRYLTFIVDRHKTQDWVATRNSNAGSAVDRSRVDYYLFTCCACHESAWLPVCGEVGNQR